MKRILLITIGSLVTAAFALALWVYVDVHRPVYHAKSGIYIDIPKGSSQSFVVQKLVAEGIVKRGWTLALYLKLTGTGSRFKAGEYQFASPISPSAVFAKLERGQRRLVRVTVVEGWTRWDIARAMSKIPALNLSDQVALELMDDVGLVRDLDPEAKNLEGYLFPDTYEFAPETSPDDLIKMMVKRFREVWTSDWSAKALELHMSPREIVTTASLIETEAKIASERPVIASVIYNRLRLNVPLAIDSSLIYASKLEGKWRNDGKVYKSDVERRSPYNTRVNAGLPPGPVASPGKSALLAALTPQQTDYLFYVRNPSRDDGTHNFYNNARDFAIGVEALRKWERERDLAEDRKKT